MRFQSGVSRSCHRATPASGARPCSTKISLPLGFTYALHLPKRPFGVPNRTERPRQNHRIDTRVLQRQGFLGGLREEFDINPPHPLAGHSLTFNGRIDASRDRMEYELLFKKPWTLSKKRGLCWELAPSGSTRESRRDHELCECRGCARLHVLAVFETAIRVVPRTELRIQLWAGA